MFSLTELLTPNSLTIIFTLHFWCLHKMSFQQNEDILNAALDELDDGSDDEDEDDSSHDENDVEADQQEVNKGKQDTTIKTNTHIHKPTFGPVPPPPTSLPRNEEEGMLKVMGELESFLKDESNGAQSKTKGDKKVRPSNKSSRSGESSNGRATGTTGANDKKSFTTELDSAISNLLGEIGKSSELPNNLEGMESDMANDFFKEFEKSTRMPSAATSTGKEGDSEDGEIMGDVVNGMMKQLLGKELMYEPMKGICDRFPQWLAENKSKLGDEDYQRCVYALLYKNTLSKRSMKISIGMFSTNIHITFEQVW